MAKGGEGEHDFRSESERIRERPERETIPDSREYDQRVEGRIPTHFALSERNADQGGGPDNSPGPREFLDHPGGQPENMREDKRIYSEIKGWLLVDPSTALSDIRVQVLDGRVTLEGEVDTLNTKYHLDRLLERVQGVKEIENRLKARYGETIDEFTRGADASRLREQFARLNKFR